MRKFNTRLLAKVVGGLMIMAFLFSDLIKNKPLSIAELGALQLLGMAAGLCLFVAGFLSLSQLRQAGLFLLSISPFLAWIFTRSISLDLWYDELYSLEYFVFVPLKTTFLSYNAPNNHIALNLINNLYLKTIGVSDTAALMDNPAQLRLLMLAFSVLTLVYLYLIGKKFFHELAGYSAAVILATTIPFFNFAVQIRGYGLSILFACMLVYYLWSYEEKPAWGYALGSVISGALMLYTIPTNIYFVAGVGSLYFASGMGKLGKSIILGAKKGPLMPTLRRIFSLPGIFKDNLYLVNALWIALSCLIVVLLYLPVLSQLRGLMPPAPQANPSLAFRLQYAFQIMAHFLSKRVALLPLILIALVGLFIGAGKEQNQRLANRFISLAILIILVFVLHSVHNVTPFLVDRIFVILTPTFALVLGISVYYLYLITPAIRYKEAFTLLVVSFYCYITFAYALNERDARLKADIEQGTISQNMTYNYYQAYYQPSRVFKDFAEGQYMGTIPVLLYQMGDIQATPKYLEKYFIPYRQIERLQEMVLNEEKQVYVVTVFPNQFESEVLQTYPGLQCRRLNERLNFQNVFLCACQPGDEAGWRCPAVES